MLSLGIDGGASSAKWSLIDENGTVVKQGSLEPIDGHLYRPDSQRKFDSFLRSIQNELGDYMPHFITLGITGLGSPEIILAKIQESYPLAKVKVGTDISLAYKSEFANGEGLYLYAGTGSIAMYVGEDDQEITVGGWGYLLGDEGAGYWIGREALRHLLMQIEGSEDLDPLSLEISHVVGKADWLTIREYVYSKDRSAIAALAPLVLQHSLVKTHSAEKIIDEAVEHLANLVQRLEKQVNKGKLPIAFGGGISAPQLGMGEKLERVIGRKVRTQIRDHSLTAARIGLPK